MWRAQFTRAGVERESVRWLHIQVYFVRLCLVWLYLTLLCFLNTVFCVNRRCVAILCQASLCHHFPTARAYFMSLSHFGNSFKLSHYCYICYDDYDQWSLMMSLWFLRVPRAIPKEGGKLNLQMSCVLTAPPTNHAPISLPVLRPSSALRHLKLGPWITLQRTVRVQMKGRVASSFKSKARNDES